jgi:tetraacyldisaccharide 4'-kinase
MSNKFELYLINVLRGNKKGLFAFLIKALLLPLSWVYGICIQIRNFLYEIGFMRLYTPPVPLVISIGNIVAGGTGKTPVTLLLAQTFYERFSVAILTRGYRSKAEKLHHPLLLSEGNGPLFPASYCGDEAFLFAQRLPKAIVVVGGDRRKASFIAAKAGAQAIFLDDAMQHRRLARDFDVVVVDIGDPFGQGHLLPRGFLREDPRSLHRADIIVINHTQSMEQFNDVKQQIARYSAAPVVGSLNRVTAIRDLQGNEVQIFEGTPVGMFCGIANPEYFRKTLKKIGCSIVNEFILSDHESPQEKSLRHFAQSSFMKGAKYLICTEKDRVKLHEFNSLPLPIVWVKLELEIVAGHEEWQRFLQEAEKKLTNV